MTDRQRSACFLLALAGSMVAHWMGSFAATGTLLGQRHLAVASTIVTPLVAMMLLGLGLLGARRTELGTTVRLSSLLGVQLLLFSVQEVAELRDAGLTPLQVFDESTIVFGLLFQLPVAGLITWMVRLVQGTVLAPPVVPVPVHHSAAVFAPVSVAWVPASPVRHVAQRHGPPFGP